MPTAMDNKLQIAGREFGSRLIIGTAYSDSEESVSEKRFDTEAEAG